MTFYLIESLSQECYRWKHSFVAHRFKTRIISNVWVNGDILMLNFLENLKKCSWHGWITWNKTKKLALIRIQDVNKLIVWVARIKTY